jgi:hypothetical protein
MGWVPPPPTTHAACSFKHCLSALAVRLEAAEVSFDRRVHQLHRVSALLSRMCKCSAVRLYSRSELTSLSSCFKHRPVFTAFCSYAMCHAVISVREVTAEVVYELHHALLCCYIVLLIKQFCGA